MLMRLSHQNLLLFRGVNTILFQLALVYDGGEDIDIIRYTASHPGASRVTLVCMTIASLQRTGWSLTQSMHNSYYRSPRDSNIFIPWIYPTGI